MTQQREPPCNGRGFAALPTRTAATSLEMGWASPPRSEETKMTSRLFRAVRLFALLAVAGGLSGCAVYATPGYAYRSPGYYQPAPVYRPYARPYGGWGYGYGRPYGYGYGGGGRGYYGRPYW